MFKSFDKLKQGKNIEKTAKALVDSFKILWETDFDDIWSIENENNLLVALNGWLCRKSNYGENIEKLSNAEKVFYLVFKLEGEVNSGGFSYFLYNSGGDFANDSASALREIGAHKMAEICDRVLSAFGGAVPKNRDEREIVLDNTFTDEINELLSQCDNDFCKYPDDLVALNYQFVQNNKTQFTR